MTLQSGSVQVRVSGGVQRLVAGYNIDFNFNAQSTLAFADGTGVLQGNAWYAYEGAGSVAGTTLDLTTLVTPLGTLTLTAIKAMIFLNPSIVAAETLIIGAAASTQFIGPISAATTTITIPACSNTANPNVSIHTNDSAAGWVVDSTHKSLKHASGSGTPAIAIYILGIGTYA